MPEPILYLKAMGAAAVASAVIMLAVFAPTVLKPTIDRLRLPVGPALLNSAWLNVACLLATVCGVAVGCVVMSLRVAWPPASGLDRFLTIVVPAVLGVELIAGFERVPRSAAWLLRMGLAAAVPRVLLHGSVYLNGSPGGWSVWQSDTTLALSGILLAGVWGLMLRLSRRAHGTSIPLAFCLTTLCAGVTVMLAGYIKGGAAAFPMAASLATTTIMAGLIASRSSVPNQTGAPVRPGQPAMLGIGVVGSFSLLFIGCFFGRVSTGCALVILLAPLLCWVTELPRLRDLKPWIAGTLRLALVSIVLVVVLILAKRNFDRDMAPLLEKVQIPRRFTASVFTAGSRRFPAAGGLRG